MGRKRTDSFNFPSFGESSSDEEITKPHVAQSPSTPKSFDFSGYKMKTFNESAMKSEESKTNQQPKDEELKASEKSSSLLVKRRRINSEDTSNSLKILSPPSSIRTARKRIVNNEDEGSSEQMLKGGGYKMCIKLEDQAKEDSKADEGKEQQNEEQDYFSCFNKAKNNKRNRRTQSLLENEDEKKSELTETVLKVVPKIKYSIHSIIEEERSRTSSSASSLRSSDDFTFLYNKRPSVKKKSSFCNFSMRLSISSMNVTNSSGESNIKTKTYNMKKYTEGLISPIYDFLDNKYKSRKKLKRGSSMNISMSPLDFEIN